MEKPIIGIISPRNIKEDRPFCNFTKFVTTYPKRIIEAGGIPIGIIFPEGKFQKEQMDICDGFVLQGGPLIESGQINAVHYAIEKNKPILGICLGMQTMAGYNWVYEELGDTLTYKEIEDFFKPEEETLFLEKKNGHNELDPFYLSQIEKSKHEVIFDKKSKLYKMFGSNVKFPSLHNFIVKDNAFDNSKMFKIVGKSKDGVIEAIEGLDQDNFIVGVQFHPELEKENKILFKELVKSSKKRRKI